MKRQELGKPRSSEIDQHFSFGYCAESWNLQISNINSGSQDIACKQRIFGRHLVPACQLSGNFDGVFRDIDAQTV